MRTFFLACIFMLLSSLPAKSAHIRVAYVDWDCAIAVSHLVKAALESRGHSVTLHLVNTKDMWQAVASADVDATVSVWLPATHKLYMDRYASSVEDLGPLVTGARLGWAVPDYVPVKSIPELRKFAGQINSRIIGIDPDAGLMQMSRRALGEYSLPLTLVESSGSAMASALGEAVRKREPIVVTAWSPHWMFGRWKLRYLEDPKAVFGKSEAIHAVVRKGLRQDAPELYGFLGRFRFADLGQLENLMMHNATPGGDPLRNARRFMERNPELVSEWFGG